MRFRDVRRHNPVSVEDGNTWKDGPKGAATLARLYEQLGTASVLVSPARKPPAPVTPRKPLPGWMVGVATAVVVLSLGALSTLVMDQESQSTDVPPTGDDSNGSPSPLASDLAPEDSTWPLRTPPTLQFAATDDSGSLLLEVRYPNSDVFVWSIPSELPVHEATGKVKGWITTERARSTFASEFLIVQGEIGTWFNESELAEVISREGKTGRIYEKTSSPAGQYLVFDTTGWLMWFYTPEAFTDEQVTTWLEKIDIRTDGSRWPVIDVSPPLQLAPPSEFPPMVVEIEHPGFTLSLFPAGCQGILGSNESSKRASYVVRCLDGSEKRVDVSVHDTTYGSAQSIAQAIAIVEG